ncbi:MAG: hypothetical protein U9O66_02390 [Patescibacteria group bacterium]|nr:hypothetical protein [Patescibacteria group bacterium]
MPKGKEITFYEREKIETYLTPSYFCDPCSSWQKGAVENLNGLIREYFPKKTNLDKAKFILLRYKYNTVKFI